MLSKRWSGSPIRGFVAELCCKIELVQDGWQLKAALDDSYYPAVGLI